jgi:FkbM family methyltransferase
MRYAHAAFCYRFGSFLRSRIRLGAYTVRSGVARGLKRRGGFGFIPRRMSPEETFLTALDLRGKTVFDLGGYQGIYTLFFARAVGANGRVITFEPNPLNSEAIHQNVELNGFNNVILKQIALSDRAGRADLLFPVREPARGTLRADYQAHLAQHFESRKVSVTLDTLDNQLEYLPAPDFIKIDVEGAELEVLRGMTRLLGERRPALFIEVHTGVDVRSLITRLADANYEMTHIERGATIMPEDADTFENGHLYCFPLVSSLPIRRALETAA